MRRTGAIAAAPITTARVQAIITVGAIGSGSTTSAGCGIARPFDQAGRVGIIRGGAGLWRLYTLPDGCATRIIVADGRMAFVGGSALLLLARLAAST